MQWCSEQALTCLWQKNLLCLVGKRTVTRYWNALEVPCVYVCNHELLPHICCCAQWYRVNHLGGWKRDTKREIWLTTKPFIENYLRLAEQTALSVANKHTYMLTCGSSRAATNDYIQCWLICWLSISCLAFTSQTPFPYVKETKAVIFVTNRFRLHYQESDNMITSDTTKKRNTSLYLWLFVVVCIPLGNCATSMYFH